MSHTKAGPVTLDGFVGRLAKNLDGFDFAHFFKGGYFQGTVDLNLPA